MIRHGPKGGIYTSKKGWWLERKFSVLLLSLCVNTLIFSEVNSPAAYKMCELGDHMVVQLRGKWMLFGKDR